jgi:hypothetical protein
MLLRVLGLLMLASCTPVMTNPVIEVRPVTANVATLPASASSSPDQVGALAREPQATPFMADQVWIGHYMCPQGETALVLHIVRVDGRNVDAIFDFRHPPTAVEGSYKINGHWDPSTHTITFNPGEWLEQPSGYTSVGMTGLVSGATFEGKINHPSCTDFSLVLNNDEDWD